MYFLRALNDFLMLMSNICSPPYTLRDRFSDQNVKILVISFVRTGTGRLLSPNEVFEKPIYRSVSQTRFYSVQLLLQVFVGTHFVCRKR